MKTHSRFTYQDRKTREISFPLGGIGTGCIGLAGNGRLIDWEIFNKPNKGSYNGFSHFAVKAEQDGAVVDARVLHGDLHPPYNGNLNGPAYNSFGFGVLREYLTGLPHFRGVEFNGEFPLAYLEFLDDSFPGKVCLTAFNPFIPLNEDDSGIPAALFEFEIENTTSTLLIYTLVGTLSNPLAENNIHSIKSEDGRLFLHLTGNSSPRTGPGDLTLALQGDDLSAQAYWFRGSFFDGLEVYWRELNQPGGLKARGYPIQNSGAGNSGSLATRLSIAPGQKGRARFIITWNFPIFENYWNADTNKVAQAKGIPTAWKNHYAVRFEDSLTTSRYVMNSWNRLYAETCLFKDALYGSDLDEVVIDAVAANLAVMKSPTVLRLEDGTCYGFEGCSSGAGCCEGSCTHVWNYAQAVAFLFPGLERSMREIDFNLNQRSDGGMRFRLPLPAGLTAEDYWVFHPCADGQFGSVIKAYADWKISGDTDWLRRFWPAIKKAIEFAWAPNNEYRWDPEKKGVLTGRMHHTLDMELFGPDAWLSGFYLAALKAGAEMAEAMGEVDTAREYRAIFQRGKTWVDANLFNGEYYHQIININDRSILDPFSSGGGTLASSSNVIESYWNAEHGEIKYQIGDGCEIDQMLAQVHANLYGLGEVYDPAQAHTALHSLFKYNFKRPMRGAYNPCRIFALNDEAGLVMCEWPEGKRKPMIPLPYSQEVMTGFEYAAAVLMIQSGLFEQGLEVVAAVRDRYDGEKRNPWNEIECGSNYVRSMASYALLPAFSGFKFDLSHKMIGFNPIRRNGGRFRAFWSLGSGWGVVTILPGTVTLEVFYGTLELKCLCLPFLQDGTASAARAGGVTVPFNQAAGEITFSRSVNVYPGSPLVIDVKPE